MSKQISDSEKIKALDDITSIKNISLKPGFLIEDIELLAQVCDDSEHFAEAVKQTCHHLALLVLNKLHVSELDYNYKDYKSCHYQSRKIPGQKADMRIVYKREGEKILVKGFGNRWIPDEIYLRLAKRLHE